MPNIKSGAYLGRGKREWESGLEMKQKSQNKRTSIQSNLANKTPPLQGIYALQQPDGNLTLFQKTNPDIPTKAGPQSPRKK